MNKKSPAILPQGHMQKRLLVRLLHFPSQQFGISRAQLVSLDQVKECTKNRKDKTDKRLVLAKLFSQCLDLCQDHSSELIRFNVLVKVRFELFVVVALFIGEDQHSTDNRTRQALHQFLSLRAFDLV